MRWRRRSEAFSSEQTDLTACTQDFVCLTVSQFDIKIKGLRRNNGRQSGGNSSAIVDKRCTHYTNPASHIDELFWVTSAAITTITAATTATAATASIARPSHSPTIVVVVFASCIYQYDFSTDQIV